MSSCIVRITDKALSDMECIYNYISEHLFAPEAAMNQYNRIGRRHRVIELLSRKVQFV